MSTVRKLLRPRFHALFLCAACFAGCSPPKGAPPAAETPPAAEAPVPASADAALVPPRPEAYANVVLTADLSDLSEAQRDMLVLLVQASQIMDDLFWQQAFRDGHEAWLESIDDAATRHYARINYGPWDRLTNDRPFIEGYGEKPAGANFYPGDMTREEFEAAELPGKTSLYTLIRRNEAGELIAVPYHDAYAEELGRAAELLRQAADLAEHEGFAGYLRLRADALVTDVYQPSDLAWLDVKTNPIELVIGPIETYEDQLFGYKAAYESFVLVKDMEWSQELARFVEFLPELQQGLPVPEELKAETPGTDADLNAYDAVYYAGHGNAGSKTIAINLPNDEEVQLRKGTRRLQIKNAMRAKFDEILVPIADMLIVPEQRPHVTFDAFFANTMFHEVAHGLGIKNTINGKGTVREALLDVAGAMEEGKADILGLYMIARLHEKGEMGEIDLRDNYVTFVASIFRSIRFGASNAHGRANMVRFNFFADRGAIVRDAASGRYRVDFDRMQEAVTGLSTLLLTLQGNGDYAGAVKLLDEKGVIGETLRSDLDRLAEAGIPVDIEFEQGLDVLGLAP
ncbi:MAG TPA: Zn-dependent hydrolase [Woeseiaceae bacterium]|nr:Zn-dependent hydrolase [Woeseiaceae bacterium]